MKTILIHGVGQTSSSWDLVIQNTTLDCQTIDLFSFHKYTFDEIYAEMQKQIHGTVNLVGLSLGGLLALQYAKQHPKNVHKLVLIGVPHKIPKVIYTLQNVIFHFMPKSTFTELGCTKQQFISLMQSCKNIDIQKDIQAISCQTYILCGAKDTMNQKSMAYFKEWIPHCESKLIPEAGHEVNEDAPISLANTIQSFLSESNR